MLRYCQRKITQQTCQSMVQQWGAYKVSRELVYILREYILGWACAVISNIKIVRICFLFGFFFSFGQRWVRLQWVFWKDGYVWGGWDSFFKLIRFHYIAKNKLLSINLTRCRWYPTWAICALHGGLWLFKWSIISHVRHIISLLWLNISL